MCEIMDNLDKVQKIKHLENTQMCEITDNLNKVQKISLFHTQIYDVKSLLIVIVYKISFIKNEEDPKLYL